MITLPLKTEKITVNSSPLIEIVDAAVAEIPDSSILVITSKIVSICEGRVVKIGAKDKQMLVREESDMYIPPEKSKYDISLTITRNMLIPTAGIDESNGNGYYILWPADPYVTAAAVRRHLAEKFGRANVGVLITDSKTTPMRLGTTGTALGYSGFSALNNYIGAPDLFGRELKVTKANVADGLAASAVLAMGEGNEQTPLCLISDIPFVRFDPGYPTAQETEELHISLADDIYSPLIQSAPWQKGDKQ